MYYGDDLLFCLFKHFIHYFKKKCLLLFLHTFISVIVHVIIIIYSGIQSDASYKDSVAMNFKSNIIKK